MFGFGKSKPTIDQAQMGMIGMPVHINQGEAALKINADRSRQRAARLEYQLKKKIAAGTVTADFRTKILMHIEFYVSQSRDMQKRIELMKAFR